jgi:molybdopterin converting factor small subunit
MLRYVSSVVAESAPNLTIHVFGQLREYCRGAKELALSAGTVRDALEQLARDEPLLYRNICDETGKVRRHLNVFVNSENARDLSGVDSTLATGDVVTFLPAVSGG